ncbi:MAG: molybdopterin-dependent oxidoreductase [Desulfovibrio sp.]|jgi:formate dehydrogenase major subunit|nr:molybdopterin-dependent oxidoreductase [Desulfovibrio sp.]
MLLAGKTGELPTETVKGYCPFCQVRCTYQARVQAGKVVSLTGEKDNHWTGGAMCPKGMSMVELVASPYRLTEPMLRQPDGGWERITYERAVEIVSERMAEVMRKHGPKAGDRIALTMPLWDCRESEIAALMALRAAGSVHAMPPGETCVSSASNMLGLMTGVNCGSTKVDELLNAETVVLWGANVNELYPPYSRWLEQAREKGVNILYVDPRKTLTSLLADMQLRPQPGTDGVLAIGAIRYVLETRSYDESRARHQIEDFDELTRDAADYTPEKVSSITGVPVDRITAFYQAIARSSRTIVWIGGALSRYTNGIHCLRSIILLQALRDNLIGSGKGMLTFQSGKPAGDEEFIDHHFGETKAPKMNFRRLRNTMEKGALDILFLNSSYRRYPDSKGVRAAIAKVPFVVHCGFFMTEETDAASLFVPATFSPESQGSGYGNEQQVVWREKIVQAPGSCAPSWQFYRDVGRKLDPKRYPDFKDPEDLYRQFQAVIPSWKGMPLERLRKAPGGVVWPLFSETEPERVGSVFSEDRMLTENGKMKVVDSLFGRISEWDYPKGSPLGKDRKEEYPLVLTQGKELYHWQQTLTNYTRTTAQFAHGRYVSVNPGTAEKQGLQQGDKVMLETFVGGIECWVNITDSVLDGTIFTPSFYNAKTPLEENRSEHISSILPNYWDRISCQHNGVGCRLRKLG